LKNVSFIYSFSALQILIDCTGNEVFRHFKGDCVGGALHCRRNNPPMTLYDPTQVMSCKKTQRLTALSINCTRGWSSNRA